MSNFKIFLSHMTKKGIWKFSGRTNKHISNRQRMWIGLCFVISGTVTLITLGNITCWADICMSLEFAAKKLK